MSAPARERIPALDVLRGVAGILFANVLVFFGLVFLPAELAPADLRPAALTVRDLYFRVGGDTFSGTMERHTLGAG